MTTPHRYEVVVVAYRSRPLVAALLDRLGPDVAVAVVDNSRGEDGLDDVARDRPGTRYLAGPGGFGRGANAGARDSTAEALVFVNPDSAPTPAQLDALAARLDADRDLAAVCALDVTGDGVGVLGTAGWEPGVGRAVVHAVGLHKLLPRAGLWARPVPGTPLAVDWIGGACFAVRTSTFRELGGFAEDYFVYNEDVEFGRAARAAGRRVEVDTDVVVPTVADTSGDSRVRMLRVRGASMVRYLRRHHPVARVEAVRAVLTVGMAPRWVRCRLDGRREEAAEHAAWVRGLWRGRPA